MSNHGYENRHKGETMEKKLRHLRCIAAAVVISALAGCLVPEKFEATLAFNPNGSYDYKYQGTAISMLELVATKEGKWSRQDELKFKLEREKFLQKNPGWKKFNSLGEGRYDILIEQDMKPGENVNDLKFFRVDWAKNDQLGTVTAHQMKKEEAQEFKKLNIKINGVLNVTLPPGARVLKHNASSTPGMWSKSYSWTIGSIDDQPEIRFELNPK
jgi:hypothetical protein